MGESDLAYDLPYPIYRTLFSAPQYKAVQQLPTPTPTSLLFPDQPPSSDQLQYAQGFLGELYRQLTLLVTVDRELTTCLRWVTRVCVVAQW